jgi:hypothetical protein
MPVGRFGLFCIMAKITQAIKINNPRVEGCLGCVQDLKEG